MCAQTQSAKNKRRSSKERRFRPGWPSVCTKVRAEMAFLQTRTAGPGLAMNCKHRHSMKIRGNVHGTSFGPCRGLPVRQQKSACHGIPKRDAPINTAPDITSAIHNSRVGGIPIFATCLYTKGEKWVILCLHGAAMPLLMEVWSP